jgi:hypothetical protein
MSRRIRFALLVVLTSIALGATACGNPTAPRADGPCAQGSTGGYC